MFKAFKLQKIIKKATNTTANEFKNKTPHIHKHFFYGAAQIDPKNLAIWYLFKTNKELEKAKASGLVTAITDATIKNLIDAGYPKEAFVNNDDPVPQIAFAPELEVQHTSKIELITHRKPSICFTTEQDINEKTNGDHRLYFQ